MKKARNYTSKLIDDLLDEITHEEQEITDKRMLLAARIDDAIKAKGWNKQDFAKAMNKYPSEISKWLSGTHNFNIDTLFKIEQILDVCLINLSEKTKPQVTKFNILVSSKVESPMEKPYYNPYSPLYEVVNEESSMYHSMINIKQAYKYKA